MRQIAAKVKITAGSLYHHFPGKQELYMAAMKQAFTDRTHTFTETISADAPPDQRLRNLISMFCKDLQEDKVFLKLIHREILDGNKKRLHMVVDEVFKDFFAELVVLCRELNPAYDPFLLAISILSLSAYHYQLTPIRKFISGSRPEHDNPKIVARHIVTLLLNGIGTARPAVGF